MARSHENAALQKYRSSDEERDDEDGMHVASKEESCPRKQHSLQHGATIHLPVFPDTRSGGRGPSLSIDPWITKHTQLLSVVHGLYFEEADVFNNFKSLLGNTLLCTNTGHPLFRTAAECMCLIGIGTCRLDNRVLTKARMRYCQALNLLAGELRGQVPKHRPRRVRQTLLCIQILSICESFDLLSWPNKTRLTAFFVHLKGAQQYAKMVGPATVQCQDDWEVVNSIRMSSWWDGLLRRKASVYANYEWFKVSMTWAPYDITARLWDTALIIPGLLERLDQLLAAGRSTSAQRHSLVLSILHVQASLRALVDRNALGSEDRRLVHLSTMTSFSQACSNKTFLAVYEYTSSRAAQLHLLALTATLFVNCTYLKLLSHTGMHAVANKGFDEVEMECVATASDFCRAVPYCMQFAAQQTKLHLIALLAVPRVLFEEASTEPELQWCLDVYHSFYSHSTPKRLRFQPNIANRIAEGLRYRLPEDARTNLT